MSVEPRMPPREKRPKTAVQITLVIFIGGLALAWLLATPPGLLGKSDAVAYAVCHRIGSHSFSFSDRPFSLCARCSGQYLGFLWGFALQNLLGKRRTGFPSRWALIGFVILFLLYGLDGVNSLLPLYPGLSDWSLYQPMNELRLFSGLGMGLAISAIYYPLMGQTIWKEYSTERSLSGIREWLLWIGGGIGIGLLVLTGNPLILYPLILLSTAGLITLLSMLYMVIWILLTRKENSFGSWEELGLWILAGFGTAAFQIALIDLIRYLLTGTWSGFLDQ